jgi:hypothetical protein
MKDELDDFVRQNREGFDDKEPAAKIWNKINKELPRFEKTSWWNSTPVWRAAAIVFMALSGYLLMPKHTSKPQSQDVASKEFNDVETFYIEQISEKVELIDAFKHNEGLNGFTHNFKQLEAMYFVLKEEMRNHPTQKVKDALVLNLLVRIDLLNQQLHSLEEENGEKIRKTVIDKVKKV